MSPRRIWPILATAFLCTVCSCNNSSSKSSATGSQSIGEPANNAAPRRKALIGISSPANKSSVALGTTLTLAAKPLTDVQIDSLRWFIDGKRLTAVKTFVDTPWPTDGLTTGTHRIEAVAHYSDGTRDVVTAAVVLLAPKAPERLAYRVEKVYPHDKHAYTQGLLFADNCFYESTGLKGASSLRKVRPETGEVLQSLNLPPDMFGEGLAMVGDKLFQVTWQNQTAFIYHKDDFKLLQTLKYPMQEGWGLTFDGSQLLMTDGTANLYFLDREYFSETRRIEVCDNKGLVYYLNELEWIDGKIWANVYMQDYIVIIDPKTGAVTATIDFKGLLRQDERKADTDVLNGIAIDNATGRIFITGKNWPKLFQISVSN